MKIDKIKTTLHNNKNKLVVILSIFAGALLVIYCPTIFIAIATSSILVSILWGVWAIIVNIEMNHDKFFYNTTCDVIKDLPPRTIALGKLEAFTVIVHENKWYQKHKYMEFSHYLSKLLNEDENKKE